MMENRIFVLILVLLVSFSIFAVLVLGSLGMPNGGRLRAC